MSVAMAAMAVSSSIAAASTPLQHHESPNSISPIQAPPSSPFRQQQLLRRRTPLRRCCTNWRQVNATVSSSPNYIDSPIDVPAEVKAQKILVLGGNGFVGTAVCKAAVVQGISVVSLSRSGRPMTRAPWADRVTWVAGDVFHTDWDSLLGGVQAVVSTLGKLIGPDDQIEKINGEANITAINAAKKAGVQKFIYISVHDYNLPEFALNNGYFNGKRKTETEILASFPTSGTILRPGFIYGTKNLNGVDVPLNLLGEPLEKLLQATATFTRPLQNLPASDLLLALPVSVDDVGAAVIKALVDDSVYGVFNIDQIKEMAKGAS